MTRLSPAPPARRPRPVRRAALVLALAACGLAAAPSVALGASETAWPVIGQQGLVRFVLVPTDHATDLPAYEAQLQKLCDPERTCFLNFYTNATGAEVALPLPDAIANEATATYRRSMKNGVEVFLWSCRLQVPGRECF